MSDQQHTFEAEVRQIKVSKLTPDPKQEELTGQNVHLPKRRAPRTFSRETVVRLIDWLKQE